MNQSFPVTHVRTTISFLCITQISSKLLRATMTALFDEA